jgi:integrase
MEENRMALSDLTIRTAKPGAKPIRLSDSGGLYLELAPSGGKLWRLKYRFGGKEKRLALGKYPDVSLKDARDRRDEARKLLANEIDPGENRKVQKAAKTERAANSFEVVAREWIAKFTPTWAATHTSKIVRRLEMYVFPWLGGRPIAEITAPELLAVARRVEDAGAIETAHRILQNCGQVFRYGVATGRVASDPTRDLRGKGGALQSAKPMHMAAITEPRKVAELLRIFDTYQGTLTVRCALQLAPLVFVRPGELRAAEWADIDLDAAEWRYIASKKGNAHIVPLATQAVATLRELHALTGDGRYVFPSARTGERPMSDNAVLAAMRRLGIAKDEMSGHGFRAMARTILDEVLGFRPDLIEHQLAHAVRDPNGRAYNRTAHLPERKKMMQQWADFLDKLKAGADVIPLHGKTAAR